MDKKPSEQPFKAVEAHDQATEKIEHLPDHELTTIPSNAEGHVSYGKSGMKGLVESPYVLGAAFLASMGGFSFGYDQGVISIVNVMDEFHKTFPQSNTAFGKGFMTGMLEFGAFLGCFFMPTLADMISRKRALTVVVVIFNIGAIMQTAAQSYGVLVAGRTIGGIGVGTLAMGAPIYISEIAPPNLRGTLLVLESISIVTGVVSSFWITYGTRHLEGQASFRVPFGLQMVCSTILGIGIHFYPYSPRWLALVDRPREALQSLSRLRRLPETDVRVQMEHADILSEVEIERCVQEKRHPGAKRLKLEVLGWLDLFRKKVWRRTAVGVGVAFFQQFSGINAFIYYAPTLFQSLGQSAEMSLVLSGVFNTLQLVAVALCFVIIDKVGRRPLAIFGGAGGGVAWTIMAVLTGLYSKNWFANPAAGWAAAAMAFCFILVFGVSYSPLGWALPAEVFPNAMRSKGVALSTAVNWLCNFIVGVATPPMLENLGFGTYVFFGFWCYCAAVWAFFLVPETKGKTLEQMDEVFGDFAAQEEKEIMRQHMAQTRATMVSEV
ncbi:high-affinity glucose protein [Diplodia corticola]|uniref:High-affinity glucose protein n=1 Tax=Diplodia corticola TaxID=236234 RepID=A0A1J9R0D0_9PEZI|nr:high-affinity glucose protein [Diplodia corticola]OJD34080.1 high-affinity glucose protein [Diplodia corticola]